MKKVIWGIFIGITLTWIMQWLQNYEDLINQHILEEILRQLQDIHEYIQARPF